METRIYPAQMDTQSVGKLQFNVVSELGSKPIENATIEISYTGNPTSTIEKLQTDSQGQTQEIELDAPPLEYSMEPSVNQPYAEYNFKVTAPGYAETVINGAEILPVVTALQNIELIPLEVSEENTGELFVIPPHTLFGDYPPKIAESEIKTVAETGEIVLSEVVIPEYVVVHDGPPSDNAAKNYYVKYKDYIKNVASSEIYATWSETTIQANVLAILSFTLNRVYTEWYRNKGYNFTITNSTAFDHKWILNRNIFESISKVVDTIFSNYLSRPDIQQPVLTQYCDGKRVQCPNWMTQWGSKYLGDQGYSPIEILRYYYGESIYINTAEQIAGVPSSWPGYDLSIGSSGQKVRQMQEQLNVIANTYSAIPKIVADGVYGSQTAEAVRQFQKIFKLPQSGIVDYPTWYKISEIYVGVSRIAELNP